MSGRVHVPNNESCTYCIYSASSEQIHTSSGSQYFRYILTKQLHACDCAKEVCFCRLPVNLNFESFLGNLPCCFCLGLYIFHQRKMINPSWILNQTNCNKTEVERATTQHPTSTLCRDLQLRQPTSNMKAQGITAHSVLHNSCFSWSSYKTPYPPQGFPILTARIKTTNYLLACCSQNKLFWIPVSKCQLLGQREYCRFKSKSMKESKTQMKTQFSFTLQRGLFDKYEMVGQQSSYPALTSKW